MALQGGVNLRDGKRVGVEEAGGVRVEVGERRVGGEREEGGRRSIL